MEQEIKALYLALVNQLSNQVPDLKHIDWYNDQYGRLPSGNSYFGYTTRGQRERESIPFSRPAVLIEFERIDIVRQGQYGIGELTVNFHVLTDIEGISGTSSSQTMDHLDLAAQVRAEIARLVTPSLVDIREKRFIADHQQDELNVNVVQFNMELLVRYTTNIIPRKPVIGVLVSGN